MRGSAARADAGGEMLTDAVGDEEVGLLRPPVAALGEASLLVAERLTVGRGGVVLVRGAVTDVAVQYDERGTPLRLPEDAESLLDAIEIVGVTHSQDVPPVGEEPRGDVLREGEARLSFDRDVVVVVDPAEVVQTQVTGQGGRFGRDALHQAAVSAHDVDVVVEDREARPVVPVGEPLPSDGHPHARGDALPERARGALDTRHSVILGVPGRPAAELAKAADVLQRHRGLPQPLVVGIHRPRPGQMQHGPEQHRGVTVGEHEPITVGPDGVIRVEAHLAVPDRVNERRERHRRAGVPRLGLLDRIDGERANGVDRQLVEPRVGHRFSDSRNTHRGGLVGWSSREATLLRRRKCRGAWLNSAARNVCTRSQATPGPTVRPPMHMMFIRSSSTPCPAEKWSWINAARMAGTLLAQIEAPTPLPQTATPRSTVPAATAWASGMTKSG